MTYRELYESAINKLEKSEITLGEFERMIKPLNAEVGGDSDTISRAKAIEELKKDKKALEHIINGMSGYEKEFDRFVGQRNQVDYDIHAIEQLPSAQPERTCVNCGRTANNGGWYADGGTRCPIEEHYALPKDGYCHLWEKRNVTDDNYPERRTDE